MNPQIAARFLHRDEPWRRAVDRVSALTASRDDERQVRADVGNGRFVPAGQIWRGAGVSGACLYNCFVTRAQPYEPAQSIAERISEWTLKGCGVGVYATSWAASFPAPAAALRELADAIARRQQRVWDMGIRRTATMLTADLDTPGLVETVRDLTRGRFRHLNIGVLVSDSKMQDFAYSSVPLGFTYPDATAVHSLVKNIWCSGNPGVIFVDRVNANHPFAEQLRACNPCAEQHLEENEGCNLGSINLAAFTHGHEFGWQAFEASVSSATKYLDAVVDASGFPCEEAAHLAKRRRRIGLGVMGLHTALQALGISYHSDAAADFTDEMARRLRAVAEATSSALGDRFGPFPDHLNAQPIGKRRNAYLTSIAPTGGISLLWNVSPGIEPDFRTRDNSCALQEARARATADLRIMSICQNHVDGGISKTVNVPASMTIADVARIFVDAWRNGAKAISLFRDGSRQAPFDTQIPRRLSQRRTRDDSPWDPVIPVNRG
jgi:ribonucleotide reductase alpha subunit